VLVLQAQSDLNHIARQPSQYLARNYYSKVPLSCTIFVIADIISLLYFFVLFVETVSSSNYIASGDKMTNELRRVKDETVVTYSMALW
jgi:hypothetical protein